MRRICSVSSQLIAYTSTVNATAAAAGAATISRALQSYDLTARCITKYVAGEVQPINQPVFDAMYDWNRIQTVSRLSFRIEYQLIYYLFLYI